MEKGNVSSWVEFLRHVKNKRYGLTKTSKLFTLMVDKGDYESTDAVSLINYAWKYGSTKPSPK